MNAPPDRQELLNAALGYAAHGRPVLPLMPGGKNPATRRDRPMFVVKFRPLPGVDPIRALRALLKAAGRHYGLKAISVEEKRP